jgi:hypothetical protein
VYDYPQLKKDIHNTGVGILELSNTAQEYIKEFFNKHSIKTLITRNGTLHLNTTSGMVGEIDDDDTVNWEYDTTLITKLKEKIIDINKTMDSVWKNYKYKDITYRENSHNPNEPAGDASLWYFDGSYEKLTVLRKWLVDNYKTSIFQMWYEIGLQNIQNPTAVDVTKIHEELTKIYLELYGDLEEVQNFGREYNPKENLTQTFRLQVYEEGCFISPHRDGGDGHCSMLLYTNEDYVEGMGGELVCIDIRPGRRKKEITVPPTIGTLAIVDFKSNPSHAVNVIKEKDWMRTTIGCWWPAGVGY